MLTSIAGKSVVVTGASKGIGKGIARVFARNGAKVTIIARHHAEAKAAAKELGGDASAAIADVTNLAELEKMAKSAARRNGGIDVLCANAGGSFRRRGSRTCRPSNGTQCSPPI